MNIKQCWQKGICLIILYFVLILKIFELVQTNYFQNILISLPIIEKSEKVVSISWNCPINLSLRTYPYYNASWCTQEFFAGTYETKLKLRELLYLTEKLQSTRRSIPLTTCEKELFHQYRQARSSTKRSDVIVYLTQKLSHKVYKRDVFLNTKESLDMLFQHYSGVHDVDILLLTNKNNFNDDDRAILSQNGTRKNLRFFEIAGPYWDYIPECIDPKIDLQHVNTFTFGYRQMIRLYSTTIPDLLHNLGYEWMMRMDEESIIHSQISYNLFDFMRMRKKVYGCRILVQEIPAEFQQHVNRFFSYRDFATNRRIFAVRPNEGCYNNWYISKISFWHKPEVRDIVDYMDASGGNFYFRWNDILTQTAALAFLDNMNQFYVFRDFTYSHLTMVQPPKAAYGGLVVGSDHSTIHGVTPYNESLDLIQKYAFAHQMSITGKCVLHPMQYFHGNQCYE